VARALAAGLVTAFAVNMRTSYVVMYLGFWCVFLVMRAWEGQTWYRTLLVIVAFAGGYALFERGVIGSLRPSSGRGAAYTYSSHTIAHPLVLGLAVPETPFASLRMYALALDALFSFSAAPLRLASRVGVMLVVPGVAYLAYVVIR
jgi:hypothetical protein